MCGINGIVYKNKDITGLERLSTMNTSLTHRGPDAEGKHSINDRVYLGHRRLSIIDLNERSNQPMFCPDGDVIIVFNGEIINFKKIKNKLLNNYDFITNSDTEVLLAGYKVKGIEWLLNEIRGMYSFSIYDKRTDETFLVRDRLGIKPLFYTISEKFLIFSSEIKGILSSGLHKPKFNEKAVDDYLAYRYVREPNTF